MTDLTDFIKAQVQSSNAIFVAAAKATRELIERPIIAHLWSDLPPEDRPADLVADLIERHDYWQKRAEDAERRLNQAEGK